MAHTATTRQEAFAPLHDESTEYAWQCWGIPDPDHGQRPISWRAEQLASYWFAHPAHADVEAFLCWLPITIGGTPVDDPYPEWHASTTDFELVTRLHLIRLYHNWEHETALCTYLDTNPERLDALGVESRPSQSTLYSAWHDRFTEAYREDLAQTVEDVVSVAREHDVSVPERGFTADKPDDDSTPSARSQRRLATNTAKEVWQTARPLVGPVVDLDRPDDTEIHDNAFLELHTFLGCRQDLCAETGAIDFTLETTRDRTPTGSYHRNCIRSVTIEQQRRNHRAAMTEVIARARHQGQLHRKQHVAIDITTGDPFRGKRDTEALRRQIIGTKENNDEVAYQYATVQVVGDDIPVVLDAVPVVKGMERATIVEELLEHATEMVSIDLVLMDREFDGQGVKDVCEAYGVSYLNPSRMYGDEKRTARELDLDEVSVQREADAAAAGRPPRKRLWVPRANVKSEEMLPDGGTPPDETQDADAESASDPAATKAAIRKDLVENFLAIFSEDDEESVDWALDEDLVDTTEEASYRETYAVDDDGVHHVVFETNHPDLEATDGDTSETAMIHKIARFTRQYANRWGIENGYKKIKSFMADTTSTDHRYRFFNFIFACLLYSVWRLVDLLVKRSLGDERASPRVRASTFLTIAKQNYGVDPPD